MSQARLLSVLVENRPGVLMRVASMIRRRGFNIDSLSVGPTEDATASRMTITVHVGQQQAEQAMKQLSKLIDVITIDDITGERVVSHEMLLVKIDAPPSTRGDLFDIVEIFRGRVVDVASDTVIVEVTGSEEKIDNFLEVVSQFGIKEVARSGAVAMVRGNRAWLRLVESEAQRPEPAPAQPAGAASANAGDMTGNV